MQIGDKLLIKLITSSILVINSMLGIVTYIKFTNVEKNYAKTEKLFAKIFEKMEENHEMNCKMFELLKNDVNVQNTKAMVLEKTEKLSHEMCDLTLHSLKIDEPVYSNSLYTDPIYIGKVIIALIGIGCFSYVSYKIYTTYMIFNLDSYLPSSKTPLSISNVNDAIAPVSDNVQILPNNDLSTINSRIVLPNNHDVRPVGNNIASEIVYIVEGPNITVVRGTNEVLTMSSANLPSNPDYLGIVLGNNANLPSNPDYLGIVLGNNTNPFQLANHPYIDAAANPNPDVVAALSKILRGVAEID